MISDGRRFGDQLVGNRYVHGSIRSHRGELWSTTNGDFMVEMNILGGGGGPDFVTSQEQLMTCKHTDGARVCVKTTASRHCLVDVRDGGLFLNTQRIC